MLCRQLALKISPLAFLVNSPCLILNPVYNPLLFYGTAKTSQRCTFDAFNQIGSGSTPISLNRSANRVALCRSRSLDSFPVGITSPERSHHRSQSPGCSSNVPVHNVRPSPTVSSQKGEAISTYFPAVSNSGLQLLVKTS